MEVKLYSSPKGVTIIEGFPGFGLVGTIATEFLIDHLKCELIGKIVTNELPAMVAIHGGKVVDPIGIFYNKEYNIVLVQAVTPLQGLEWELTDAVIKMAKELGAKEIISLEGIGSMQPGEESSGLYYYSSKNSEKYAKLGLKPLKEGIIMGVTGAMLTRGENLSKSAIFAETQSNMPDSKAAASVIQILDKYLGLEVDTKPLLEQAAKFEQKLQGIMKNTQEASKIADQKKMSYVG